MPPLKPPDFFIVGAPKCGTSSMFAYLGEHPRVFLPARGELNFFSDAYIIHRIPDLDSYLRYFAQARSDQVVGEKSVTYLFAEESPPRLKQFNPAAKIIVLLRNPADMVFSLHRQNLFSGNEDIIDFDQALAAEEDRRVGDRIPKASHNPRFLQYRAVATFTPQVARYFETFGRENVRVILLDDLKADPACVYSETLTFLQLEPRAQPAFTVHNAAKHIPNIRLRSFMKTHPKVSKAVYGAVPQGLVYFVRSILGRLQRQPPRVLDPRIRATLLAEFHSEIVSLSALLERDLRCWHV